MSKVILFIDGDNIDESYTQSIYENAQAFGEVYETHCFADFVKRKQRWYSAYTEYQMQLHYVPGSDKQKGKADPNTSDIALTALAMEKMYECGEIDVCIIAANDKDYIPLAKVVREKFHKKVVMFYTQQNDKAITSYDEAVLLKQDGVKAETEAEKETSRYYLRALRVVLDCLDEQPKNNNNEILLADFGLAIKNRGIDYGTSRGACGEFLKELFKRYPFLEKHYVLKLGDMRDRIECVA